MADPRISSGGCGARRRSQGLKIKHNSVGLRPNLDAKSVYLHGKASLCFSRIHSPSRPVHVVLWEQTNFSGKSRIYQAILGHLILQTAARRQSRHSLITFCPPEVSSENMLATSHYWSTWWDAWAKQSESSVSATYSTVWSGIKQ